MNDTYNRRIDGKPDYSVSRRRKDNPRPDNQIKFEASLIESHEECIKSIQRLLDKRR